METAYSRLHAATTAFREENPPKTKTPDTSGCACCTRPWDQVEDPYQAAIYRYDTGFAIEWVCTTCYTPRPPSFKTLGVERLHMGKPENPVGGKLGMLPGCSGLITSENLLHLGLNQKTMDKFKDGLLGRAGQLHVMQAIPLLLNIVSEGRAGRIEEGIVFIEEWGRKADVLMANLAMTRSLREVWFNSDQGSRCVDLQGCIDTGRELLRQGLGAEGRKFDWWKPIRQAAKGKQDNDELEKWGNKVPDAGALIKVLPVDPHVRDKLPTLLRQILPFLEEGKL